MLSNHLDANPATWCAVRLALGLSKRIDCSKMARGLAAVALATALTIAPAAAVHDPSKPDYAYPQECCLDQDCAPVVSWSFVAADPGVLPVMVIETIHGTALVPHDFPRRDSKDHRMHACLKLFDTNPATRLICFFVPPTM